MYILNFLEKYNIYKKVIFKSEKLKLGPLVVDGLIDVNSLVITACIRRMREGDVFKVFVC